LSQVPLKIKEDLTLEVRPIKILDQSEKGLRRKNILMIKFFLDKLPNQRRSLGRGIENKEKYPELFFDTSMEFNFEEIIFI
jgi:hypothetical protein